MSDRVREDRARQQRLVTQQLEFLEIIENLPEVLLIASPDAQVVYANARAGRSLGAESSDELVGKSLFDLALGADRDRLMSAFSKRMNGIEGAIELKLGLAGKSDCCVELAMIRDIDFDDERSVLVIGHDVTEQRALELQVQLNNRLSSLGTLSAGVAHEINNPLAFVAANLEFVSRSLDELTGASNADLVAEMKEALNEAVGGTVRIRNIVRDLKIFARGNDEDVDSGEIAAAIDWAVKLTASHVQHRCRLESTHRSTPPVRGSHSKLSQVLVNLITNACDAMPEGRRTGLIQVSGWTDEAGNAVVEVKDDGGGIAADQLARVFEPFFTTKPIGRGTGLGLSVSLGIVRSMGGLIDVQSEVGTGTTFRITLPPANAVRAAPVARPLPAAARRLKVLIIDDEPHLASALVRMLARDHDVASVTDPRAAVTRLSEQAASFDVVLCDVMMPGMSGIDVLCAARQAAPQMAERFVFLTGGIVCDSVREKMKSLKNPVVEKPFVLSDLMHAIKEVSG